jgi:hypothetical protein
LLKRLILVAWVAAPLAGCAMFDTDRWQLDRYRDERAVDIDRRLSEDVPIGQNPFGPPQGQEE